MKHIPHVGTSSKGFSSLSRVAPLALGLADQSGALCVKQVVPDSISAGNNHIPLLQRH